MQNEYTINGKVYRLVDEPAKQERRELYVVKQKCNTTNVAYHAYHYEPITEHTRMIEIRDGEIVVSEDELRHACAMWEDTNDIIKELFNK